MNIYKHSSGLFILARNLHAASKIATDAGLNGVLMLYKAAQKKAG